MWCALGSIWMHICLCCLSYRYFRCPHRRSSFKTTGLTNHLEKKHLEQPEQKPYCCSGDGVFKQLYYTMLLLYNFCSCCWRKQSELEREVFNYVMEIGRRLSFWYTLITKSQYWEFSSIISLSPDTGDIRRKNLSTMRQWRWNCQSATANKNELRDSSMIILQSILSTKKCSSGWSYLPRSSIFPDGYADGLIHDETKIQNNMVLPTVAYGVITLVGYADMGEDENLSNAERCFRGVFWYQQA